MTPTNCRTSTLFLAGFALFSLIDRELLAAPYEIRVYGDDIPERGESELEVMLSLARPRVDDDYPKGRVGQWLFEYSYGLAPGWAIGLQLPGVRADGVTKFKGVKVEVQYVSNPGTQAGWYWGVRSDIGYESSVYEARGGNGIEVNPIIGYRSSAMRVTFNPALEIPLSGASRKAVFRPAGKLAGAVSAKDSIGIEYFGNMGPVSRFLPRRDRDETVYLVWDHAAKSRHISVGFGQPLANASSNQDKWVAKMAISLELD